MASENDFLDMYRTLGLRPGCALPVLKQAYRRKVACLHPDRHGGQTDPDTAARLQRLIAQYDAALIFQREHGRLPGAMPRVRFAVPEASVQTMRPTAARRRASWQRPMLVVLAFAAIVTLAWEHTGESAAPEPQSESIADEAQPLGALPAAPTLALGMTRDDVRSIEGEPMGIHDDRWEYGPSWVRFEDGRVVDWYSSPLHTLGSAGRTPDSAPDR